MKYYRIRLLIEECEPPHGMNTIHSQVITRSREEATIWKDLEALLRVMGMNERDIDE